MAYKKKYELNTVDSNGKYVKVEILQDGYSGSTVHQLRGTGNPVTMTYRSDTGDYKGYIFTSSLQLEIYSDDIFNLDTLLTSDDTEYKVEVSLESKLGVGDYIPLFWQGFIVPDFFKEDLTPDERVLSITASDRLSALKNMYIESEGRESVRIRALMEECLAKTGLDSIELFTGFANIRNILGTLFDYNFFNDYYVRCSRFAADGDNKVSCWDILESFCVMTNSILFQMCDDDGMFWYVANKYRQSTLEQDTITIDSFVAGGTREVIPAISSASILHEFGKIRKLPTNYKFDNWSTAGWTKDSDFPQLVPVSGVVEKFLKNSSGVWYPADTGQGGASFYIPTVRDSTTARLYTEDFSLDNFSTKVKIKCSVGVILPRIDNAVLKRGVTFNVILKKNGEMIGWMTEEGRFSNMGMGFEKGLKLTTKTDSSMDNGAEYITKDFEGTFSDEDGLDNYSVSISIQPVRKATGDHYAFVLSHAYLEIGSADEDEGQGMMYKTEQLSGKFIEEFNSDKTIFGDRIGSGVNGYFYKIPTYDDSLFYKSRPHLSTGWHNYAESNFPLLQLGTRERARLFSSAREVLTADCYIPFMQRFECYKYCGKYYILVEGTYDFVENRLSAKLEEIKYVDTTKKDYIYTEFDKKD